MLNFLVVCHTDTDPISETRSIPGFVGNPRLFPANSTGETEVVGLPHLVIFGGNVPDLLSLPATYSGYLVHKTASCLFLFAAWKIIA